MIPVRTQYASNNYKELGMQFADLKIKFAFLFEALNFNFYLLMTVDLSVVDNHEHYE